MISLNKKNLPDYLFKLNVAFVVFLAIWFTLGVALMITIGCLYGESVITYAVMAGTFALFFVGLAVFVSVDKKLYKRFIAKRAAELEEEFCDMSFEEAERILKDKGIITGDGFAANGDVFDEEVLPFEETVFDLQFFQLLSRVNMDLVLYKNNGGCIGCYPLDRALYNFIIKNDKGIKENRILNLLKNDKKGFAEFALRDGRMLKADFRGYEARS